MRYSWCGLLATSIKSWTFITARVITFRKTPTDDNWHTNVWIVAYHKRAGWSCGQERCAKSLSPSHCVLCMCASHHVTYHNPFQRMIWLVLHSIMCAHIEDVRKSSPSVFNSSLQRVTMCLIQDVTQPVTVCDHNLLCVWCDVYPDQDKNICDLLSVLCVYQGITPRDMLCGLTLAVRIYKDLTTFLNVRVCSEVNRTISGFLCVHYVAKQFWDFFMWL